MSTQYVVTAVASKKGYADHPAKVWELVTIDGGFVWCRDMFSQRLVNVNSSLNDGSGRSRTLYLYDRMDAAESAADARNASTREV